MYQEDESSSVASSYEEEDPMEIFVDRCSICFDAQHNLCIESCRDQFCLDCFEKYIVQVVETSWGLSVTIIKCPVCSEIIPKHEWSRYVPKRVVDLYEKYNKPYRSYSRACPHCDIEITPCVHQDTHQPIYQQTSFICDILTTMISSCPKQDRHMNDKDHAVIYDWIQLFQQDMTETMLASVYKPMMKDLFKFEKHHITHYSSSKQYQHHYSYQISLLFLKSALRPEIWKQFQFAHISFFPSMNCSVCHSSICLHCGYDAHGSLTCDENMRKLIKNNKNLPNEVKKTIVWTLQNSRQCPNCSIMINRDEGCNKVDCSYCGYSFCWCCRSSWSEGCGFYRCSTDKNSNQSMAEYGNSAQAEVGVPDMKNIQERIRLNRQPPIAFN